MSTTAMRKGRERVQAQRRRGAIRRVRAFDTWKRHHFDAVHRPDELPSDWDFRAAREAGVR